MEISAGLLIDRITIRRISDYQPVAIKMSTINNIEKTNKKSKKKIIIIK